MSAALRRSAALALLLAFAAAPAHGLKLGKLEQDPCAGCTEALSQAYQTCAMKYGNPCAETSNAGLVIEGEGTKKDVSCCMKKEKHDRCMTCKTMDCSYKTCNVNKAYYSERRGRNEEGC